MQLAVGREAAHRRDRPPARRHREHEAARHRPPVQQHRAGAAHALVAAFLGVEDPERVAQDFEQRAVRLDVDVARPAVDRETRDHGGTCMACATARVRPRLVSTPVSSVR
jgi:hypothetical protein